MCFEELWKIKKLDVEDTTNQNPLKTKEKGKKDEP